MESRTSAVLTSFCLVMELKMGISNLPCFANTSTLIRDSSADIFNVSDPELSQIFFPLSSKCNRLNATHFMEKKTCQS